MLRWLGRASVLRKRVYDAWMDRFEDATVDSPEFQQAYASLPIGGRPALDDVLDQYNAAARGRRARTFPLSENLFALIVLVLADLDEAQREDSPPL